MSETTDPLAGAGDEDPPDEQREEQPGEPLLGGWVGGGLVALVAIALGWLIAWLGDRVSDVVGISPRWGTAFVIAGFLTIYLRQVTRLRLENQRLRALEALVRAASEAQAAAKRDAHQPARVELKPESKSAR